MGLNNSLYLSMGQFNPILDKAYKNFTCKRILTDYYFNT